MDIFYDFALALYYFSYINYPTTYTYVSVCLCDYDKSQYTDIDSYIYDLSEKIDRKQEGFKIAVC